MIDGRSLLAIIPARGGSKRLKDKNIRELGGKPLIAWTIEAAKKSKYVDRIIVSTDSPLIAETAQAWGADVPFMRPRRLSTDRASSNDVVVHSLEWLARKERALYDYFVLLQPTSPFRTVVHIDEAVEKMVRGREASALVSVVGAKESPFWMKVIDARGYLKPFMRGRASFSRRQDLPKVFVLNGAIYIGESKSFTARPDFYAGPCLAYIMDRKSSIDIDDGDDFSYAEYLIARQKSINHLDG